MKSKLTTMLIASSLLAGSLFAYNSNSNEYQKYHKENKSQYKCSMKNKSCAKSKKSHLYSSKSRNFELHRMFRGLNLTKEQKFKISIISDEMKLEIKKQMGYHGSKFNSIKKYLTDKGFDKANYLKDKKSKMEKFLQIRADAMENVFKVLTPEQIKMFKESKKEYKKHKKNYYK